MFQLITQDSTGGFDIIWLLLPVLCCLLFMGQRGGEKPQETGVVSDSFYTTQSIQESFDTVEEEVKKWRQDAREKQEASSGITSRLRRIVGGGPPQERFVEEEKNSPRLLRLTDSSGSIFFEFTEVTDGGTVVKATYGSAIRGRVARLKSDLPLKIPATPVGLKCPSCGKPVLQEFNVCPYCGSQLIKE